MGVQHRLFDLPVAQIRVVGEMISADFDFGPHYHIHCDDRTTQLHTLLHHEDLIRGSLNMLVELETSQARYQKLVAIEVERLIGSCREKIACRSFGSALPEYKIV